MPVSDSYRAAPRITSLGSDFYDEVAPARFPRRSLRFWNDRWAPRVGLGALEPDEREAFFARFEALPSNLARPLALRYHGHQFDVYNPYLGDGRGFLLAQLEDDAGRLLDFGTKGSGTTPWSRGGDGRLTLKGGVREVLAAEMLEALGVRTSKSFSLFETGESLMRGDEPSPTRSSVLVRLSHSHIRIGTFQRLAYLRNEDGLRALVAYCMKHYYAGSGVGGDAVGFLRLVTRANAALCASLMVAGFVHGVLNSDNMSITGESFDYGPYRFLPKYDVDFVAAYFDHQGLYSFGAQPRAFARNLVRLAESLRPLAPDVALGPALADFEAVLEEELTKCVLARLGLTPLGDVDVALVGAVYAFLEEADIGYDRFFFDVRGGRTEGAAYRGQRWEGLRDVLALYAPPRAHAYFEGEAPCSLLIDEIEAIWAAIAQRDDWGPFEAKVAAIRAMGAAMT